MATILKIAGADFSANAIGFLPPVASGLTGWFQFGSTLAQSKKNLAPGASDALVVGAPVISANYATFTGQTNYLDAGLPETDSWTFIAVARAAAVTNAATGKQMFISNLTSGLGSSLYYNGVNGASPAAFLLAGAYIDNGAGAATIKSTFVTDPDALSWGFLRGSYESGVGIEISERTQSVGPGSSAGTTARMKSAATIRIGSANNSSFTGQCDMMAAAIYNRKLTPTEETTVYNFLKTVAAKRSISI